MIDDIIICEGQTKTFMRSYTCYLVVSLVRVWSFRSSCVVRRKTAKVGGLLPWVVCK